MSDAAILQQPRCPPAAKRERSPFGLMMLPIARELALAGILRYNPPLVLREPFGRC